MSGTIGGVCRFLGLAGVALFLGAAFTPIPNLLSRWLWSPARPVAAEAIVVLGAGGVQSGGELTTSSLRLAVHGIVLYRRGFAPLLVFSGPALDDAPAEAEARALLARELGIPPDAILTEVGARTTREEAIRIDGLLRPRGIRRILLVTDAQHMLRAERLFARAGFAVVPAPPEDIDYLAGEPEDRLRLMRQVLKELVARTYYRVAGYL